MSTPDPARPEVLAVLWDADGVLQHMAGSWQDLLDAAGGDGFAEAVFAAELPALTGEVSMRACLEQVVRHWHADTTANELLQMWESFEVDEEALAVVAATRAAGVRCYLATNQQDHRTDLMRRVHGYDVWFDGSFYSSEMGVAKPSPAYFEQALAAVAADVGDPDLDPGRVAFLDDSAPNVESARALGIRAVQHDPASGADGLRRDLASLGVSLPG